MSEEKDEIEFHEWEGWTAVYLNGKLERVGDSYLADEWLQQRVGVKVVQDDAFLCGGQHRDDVAQTLEGVNVYREWRERRLAEAAKLEQRAQELRDQANSLRSSTKLPAGLTT